MKITKEDMSDEKSGGMNMVETIVGGQRVNGI
jgi:hypothetical protein